VCERILSAYAAAQSGGRLAYQAGEAVGLVLRAYADASERAEKERALDLIDTSLKLNVYGANRALIEHDRPWGGSG
jgi:hypothetical protein